MTLARRAVLVGLLFAPAILISCHSSLSPGRISGGPLVDGRSYDATSLSGFRLGHSPSVVGPDSLLFSGDFLAAPGEEIAVVAGRQMTVFGAQGGALRSRKLPGGPYGAGIVADFDHDGKQDLVLGATSGNSVELTGIDGDGRVLFDDSLLPMTKGDTLPQFAQDGRIYFAAHSRYNIGPKLIGALDTATGSLTWQMRLGEVPTALSRGRGGLIAVSSRAVGRTTGGKPESTRAGGSRQATLLYGTASHRLTRYPFGPRVKAGYFVKGGSSGVTERLLPVGKGGTEAVVELVARASELYEGNAYLRILSTTGSERARLDGPPATGGNFGYFNRGGAPRIAIAWNSAGRFEVTDSRLHPLHSRTLPGGPHDLRLLQIGEFSGAGSVDYLLCDENRVYLLDRQLHTLFSSAFPSRVRSARIIRGRKGRPRLVVLASRLYLFAPSSAPRGTLALYSRPAGARLSLDGAALLPSALPIIRGLRPGEHTVAASLGGVTRSERIRIAGGQLLTQVVELPPRTPVPDRSLPPPRLAPDAPPAVPIGSYHELHLLRRSEIPSGYSLVTIKDFVGDKRKELLFLNNGAHRFLIYDAALTEVAAHTFSGPMGPFAVVGDLNGDGKADLLISTTANPMRVRGYTGTGRLLFDKAVTNGYDSHLSYIGWAGRRLIVQVLTGYTLSPRGFYLFDLQRNRIDSFSPTAGFVAGAVGYHGRIYPNYFTPSNGAKVVRPDGSVETDSRIYLDVFNDRGEWLPESHPFAGSNPVGQAYHFILDGNGKPQLYFVVDHDPHYYTGDAAIYRVEPGNRSRLVFRGPKDASGTLKEVQIGGKNFLVVYWNYANTLDILDGGFHPIEEVHYQHPIVPDLLNLDADQSLERIYYHASTVRILTLRGRVLDTLHFEHDQIRRVFTADLDGNGKKEIIVAGTHSVAIYGY